MYQCDPICNVINFLVLIILPVANIMCRDRVLRKPIPLMCMRSQHMVTSLYLPRMILGKNVILKPRCRYNLCTCVIPSTMCSTFRFFIILPVANMMCRDMVLDLFQPKTDLFSTHALIWVHLKTMRYFYQPIFSSFLYLKMHYTI